MFTPTVPWIVYGFACLLEAGLLTRRLNRRGRILGGVLLLLLLTSSQGAILVGEPLAASIPFFIIGCYRIVNCMRLIYGRMHDEYLYRVLPKSSLYIGVIQTTVGLLGLLVARHHPTKNVLLYAVAVFQFVVASVLVASLRVNLKKSLLPDVVSRADNKLASVSVLIPARNETDQLEACLKTLTASTYQKLEILVLDDCSQDKTSDVIKAFAHDGVRFVSGNEPGEVWLPKNAAYNKLALEASGEFLLFCGVDVRFGADDIKKLVSYALEERLTMVSVLPKRSLAASPNSIAQQVRYVWELALPRFLVNRPPVLSTVWLIQATALKKYGGMSAVRRNVVPEGYFARELAKKGMYRFLRAGSTLLISSMKPPREQRDTMLRVRYPQLHRRPEVVMAATVVEIVGILGVYAVLVYACISGAWVLAAFTLAVVFLHLILFMGLAAVMGRGGVRFYSQAITAVAVDLWLMHRSMYLYEFDEVRWKDRNVCLPVMHAYPSLPRLPEN